MKTRVVKVQLALPLIIKANVYVQKELLVILTYNVKESKDAEQIVSVPIMKLVLMGFALHRVIVVLMLNVL